MPVNSSRDFARLLADPSPRRSWTLGELGEAIGARLMNPEAGDRPVRGVASLRDAGPDHVAFWSDERYRPQLKTTRALAVILRAPDGDCGALQLVAPSPQGAMARAAALFAPNVSGTYGGQSLSAWIDPGAKVDPSAVVYPFVWIGFGAEIGPECRLFPGTYVGPGARVGARSILRSHVVVEEGCEVGPDCLIHAGTVVGADGFGFVREGPNGWTKIPQVGNVVVGSAVELGAQVSVDRAALGSTVVGDGTKVDSHVHIGHNCRIGRHGMLSGMVGLAGSATLGDWVVVGGHSGINGHIHVGDGAQIGAMTGVTKSVKGPGPYLGFPAMPAERWRELQVRLRRLGSLERRLAALEARLGPSPSLAEDGDGGQKNLSEGDGE